jgi:hypothetical protein
MDSIPIVEFHKIFRRVASCIDLKGKVTQKAIEKELIKARDKCLKHRRTAQTQAERAKFKRAAMGYDRLLEYGFAARAIYEAIRDPRGIIAMTLTYGYPEAKKRILAQKRAEIRSKLRGKYWR